MAEVDYRKDVADAARELDLSCLKSSNVLVAGATGLIGSTLVEVLMEAGKGNFKVYAAGRNEQRAKELFSKFWDSEDFEFLKMDVSQPLESDVRFDYIIHAASYGSPRAFVESPVEVMAANFCGTQNLLEYGRHHGLKRMVYISSGEVYGEGDGRKFAEDYSGYVDCTSPRSCYPSSKRAAETLCVSFAKEYGVDVCIARPCHVYGPNFTSKDNRVYAQFIRNVLNNEDIVMKSTGEQFRSWCYVVDCVRALLYILVKGENMQAYNIADSSSNLTIKELAEMVAEIGGKKVVLEIPDAKEKSGFNKVTKSIFDTRKLESLGWSVNGSMQEKMRNTIKALK